MTFLGILERFVTSCTTLSATPSKTISQHLGEAHHEETTDVGSDKKSVDNLTESLVECIDTKSQMDQRSSDGGGDCPSIVDVSKVYHDDQRLNGNTEMTQKQLFGD